MWALDLGTTNTLLARWDRSADRPSLIELPEICRRPGQAEPLEAPRAVPTAVHVLDHPSWWARHFSLGRLALVGRPALELNAVRPRPNFVPSFKRALGLSPLMPVARTAEGSFSAREVARLFLRELFAHARAATGERIRDLVITTPVEAFESYRAELAAICKSLGIRRVAFLDEPVAAAIGYGLGLSRARRVLVVDFGGGTLHLALVRIDFGDVRAGKTEVLAKSGRDIGGDLVDRWLLEDLCQRLDYQLDESADPDAPLWRRLALAEACRAKEALYFQEQVTSELTAPREFRRLEASATGKPSSVELGREDLVRLLDARGLYRTIDGCLDEALAQAGKSGVGEAEIDDVLMVGGSTLLPNVYPLFEERFGRARVRAWQPFEAVAYGGCVFAAGRVEPADFIVHHYALLTYDLRTKQPEHTVIVPQGTRFPSKPDLWKRQLVPTCSLGEPEKVFKLVICEISEGGAGRNFAWDADGQVHRLGSADDKGASLVVKLNEANPALGHLDPPYSPRDTSPRLEVSFGINAERWLCATVLDLKTKKHLMRDEPVVRLL
jgi:molecular chaperone DnaK (HSP70)